MLYIKVVKLVRLIPYDSAFTVGVALTLSFQVQWTMFISSRIVELNHLTPMPKLV